MRFYLIDKNTYFHFGKVYDFRVVLIFYHNYNFISIFFVKLFEIFPPAMILSKSARNTQTRKVTRKVMKQPYLSRIAPRKAHNQHLFKPKSVTYLQ